MTQDIKDQEDILQLEHQLCFALYSTSRAITKQYAILLKEMGVTYPQYLTLLVLWQQDNILVQELAAKLEVDGATATPLVKRMEKLGLVTRQRGVEDERRVYISLTETGKALYEKALDIPHGLGCAIGVSADTAKNIMTEMKEIKDFIDQKSLSSQSK